LFLSCYWIPKILLDPDVNISLQATTYKTTIDQYVLELIFSFFFHDSYFCTLKVNSPRTNVLLFFSLVSFFISFSLSLLLSFFFSFFLSLVLSLFFLSFPFFSVLHFSFLHFSFLGFLFFFFFLSFSFLFISFLFVSFLFFPRYFI